MIGLRFIALAYRKYRAYQLMENAKPKFGISDHSPVDVASSLHSYSRGMQSYYAMKRGQLISQLDEATDDAAVMQIEKDLEVVERKMEYFHVLNNATSTAEIILQSPLMISEINS